MLMQSYANSSVGQNRIRVIPRFADFRRRKSELAVKIQRSSDIGRGDRQLEESTEQGQLTPPTQIYFNSV
jgi:hypothetical protein